MIPAPGLRLLRQTTYHWANEAGRGEGKGGGGGEVALLLPNTLCTKKILSDTGCGVGIAQSVVC